jgi:hypothetical protein
MMRLARYCAQCGRPLHFRGITARVCAQCANDRKPINDVLLNQPAGVSELRHLQERIERLEALIRTENPVVRAPRHKRPIALLVIVAIAAGTAVLSREPLLKSAAMLFLGLAICITLYRRLSALDPPEISCKTALKNELSNLRARYADLAKQLKPDHGH